VDYGSGSGIRDLVWADAAVGISGVNGDAQERME